MKLKDERSIFKHLLSGTFIGLWYTFWLFMVGIVVVYVIPTTFHNTNILTWLICLGFLAVFIGVTLLLRLIALGLIEIYKWSQKT